MFQKINQMEGKVGGMPSCHRMILERKFRGDDGEVQERKDRQEGARSPCIEP